MNELILIVEDSQTQAMLLENILEGKNYQVAIVDTGEKAINWLSENKPSLIISDIVMPGMDGYELCRQIKTKKTTNDIPVILMTSLNGTEEVIEGLVAGADSFITKPYDQDYLVSHIEKVLADQSGINTEKESFGVEILFEGKKRVIQSDQQQTIKLLLNIYEAAIQQNTKLLQSQEQLKYMNENLESLVEERTLELSEKTTLSLQIAEKLQESEEIWRTLVNTIPDFIGLYDQEARILLLNHYAEGFAEIDTIEKSLYDFISDESIEFYRQNFENCLKTGKNQVFEYTALGDNNMVRSYESTLVPLILQGKTPRVMAIARDITERKLAENEIHNKNEQLLNVNAEKDKFFSIIAHDLRSPLSSFLGITQLLVEDLPSMEQVDRQEMLVSMEKSALNLYGLLENLLEWAKIQRGLVPFNPVGIQLHAIIGESVEMLIESIKNKEIEITYDVPVDSWVIADSNMLQTVIRNLVSNAVKFTPKGGKISLLAKATGNQSIEISIKDTGIGMSSAMLEHLFQLNDQSNRPGTEGEPSSGLGLLLCKEFIEKLGGRICVESEVGVGSKFSFSIPLNVIPEQTFDQTESVLDQGKLIKAGGINILIADDDEGSNRLVALIVKSFAAKVIRVKNGVEEVKAFRENRDIELIITDIQMPEMNGYEAVKQIRQLSDKVIIIAMTDFAQTGEKEIAQEAGCNDYVSKPIKRDQLMGLMQKYFARD